MIESLCLKNFKCFREQTVQFGGITVLAGLNGSGKSSVIQAILALRQRWRGGRGSPWRGPLVNLGSFPDILHEEAADDTVRLEMSFRRDGHVHWEAHSPDGEADSDTGECDAAASRELQGDMFYLSADRLGPRQTLPYTEEDHGSLTPLGRRGEHVLWYLEKFGDAPVSKTVRYSGEPKKTLAAQVNAWLDAISPGAGLSIKVIPEADSAVGTFRYSRSADVPSRPFRAGNVGFGLSYALPPIVALLAPVRSPGQSPANLVIVENPEAHLHPGGRHR